MNVRNLKAYQIRIRAEINSCISIRSKKKNTEKDLDK